MHLNRRTPRGFADWTHKVSGQGHAEVRERGAGEEVRERGAGGKRGGFPNRARADLARTVRHCRGRDSGSSKRSSAPSQPITAMPSLRTGAGPPLRTALSRSTWARCHCSVGSLHRCRRRSSMAGRYSGVLASASKLRSRIAPKPPVALLSLPTADSQDKPARRGAYRPWAELLRRTFGFDVLQCPK